MRKAQVFVNRELAGILEETEAGHYRFDYLDSYKHAPISLTMPLTTRSYEFTHFPAFFEGLLPEGARLQALLRQYKLDEKDYFGQLIQVGDDVVGAITIKEMK